MVSDSGSAIAGEQYSIICAVIGAGNLQGATFRIEWRRTGGDVVVVALQSSLTHTFSPRLGESDAGSYTCQATITTDLLLDSLTRSDLLDVTVAGKLMCMCIKLSSFQAVEADVSYFPHDIYLILKCMRNKSP